MKKILIYSIYPTPYRFEPIQALKKEYSADVFYETCDGDYRNSKWFCKGDFFLLNTAEGRSYFNACKKKLKQYHLVVLFEFSLIESVKLIFACRRLKVPYILNCDGVMLFRHENFIKEAVKKYLIKGATAYFASGEHAKEYFIRYGAKKERIYFHNFTTLHKKNILSEPISLERKLEIRKKLNLPIDGKICIAVGRYIPLKRYDVLLKLWKDMPKNDYLLLVGGGPEKENYESIIRKFNLSNVILDDFHPFEELLEYYKASDLFVHPTSYDVWGLVINEAMACGLPVVVTDTCVAGLELVNNGENGYVIHLGEGDAFVRRIVEILNDDGLREKMAHHSIETIQPFNMENMIDSHLKTVHTVMEKNAK